MREYWFIDNNHTVAQSIIYLSLNSSEMLPHGTQGVTGLEAGLDEFGAD